MSVKYCERAIKIAALLIKENPMVSATEMAEVIAFELDKDEWLDDPEHWIWDLSINFTSPRLGE